MSYKIIIDSCGELTDDMKKDGHFATASLTLYVDEYSVVDDESFDQKDFLRRVAASPNCPKSACPSPESYREQFDCEEDHVYAVTLSSELSGSYNSAELGRALLQETQPGKKIHVFNSKSASVGETLIGLKIQECEEAGMTFEEVVRTVNAYISQQKTWFVLESLDALRKNGRLSNVKAFIATALKIKPVMTSTEEGSIELQNQARGMNRALVKMVESIEEYAEHPEERILAIAHCNCPERAEMVRDELMKRRKFRDVFVVDTAGVSSLYASDGGVIVVV